MFIQSDVIGDLANGAVGLRLEVLGIAEVEIKFYQCAELLIELPPPDE